MTAILTDLAEMQERVEKSWQILNLDSLAEKLEQLEQKMSATDFWKNQDEAKQVSQESAEIKSELEAWKNLRNEIKDLLEIISLAEKEGNEGVLIDSQNQAKELEKKLRTMELSTLFSGAHDNSNAIVSVHAGAGGTDAMDWAGMLTRMYFRFAEKKGWQVDVLEESPGEEAGYKSITFSITGRRAYGYLKSEAGVHRLVRISPFDAEKMRHTSFALVEVLPELDEIFERQLEIDPKDLRIDTFMSSGKGGQSVNTTYSAVRLTHVPTNIVVTCQNERSQSQNKDTAMKVLKARLFQRMQEERADRLEELKGGHKSPEWGNQIRSYVLHPYKMVKDHRSNAEVQDIEAVLDGDLDYFIESYLQSDVAKGRLED
ncbi:MAG: peptide chain release factor 2 [Patescibacteria group bacterium]|nr:peptide chain release factor 2 [Patescibacteria group bacterium]